MEERALYRAILAAPHDAAPRLIYADWLDENADSLPAVVARGERGRAEFIRLQCEVARLAPEGWGARLFVPLPAKRERRLIFQHGKKWRRAFPFRTSSAPFDRGFLRPSRVLRPQTFLGQLPVPVLPFTEPFPPLPHDSPARRYVSDEDGPFDACPLWDVHLYASGWQTDPLADRGQYGELLAEVAKSPALERVGWLKVSFFRTPVLDFLRTGNFANVETLELNCGPFPEVFEAVTENESFRSLRYVRFGPDRWAWAGAFPALLQFMALEAKLRTANERHVPFGEMRAVLRGILRDTPVVPVAPPPSPVPRPLQFPTWATPPATPPERGAGAAWFAGLMLFVLLLVVKATGTKTGASSSPTFQTINVPDYKALDFKFDAYKPKHSPEVEAFLKQLREGQVPGTAPKPRDPKLEELLKRIREGTAPLGFEPQGERPVAPPPRAVERKDDPDAVPDEK